MDYKMEELLPVVSELAQKYTGGESTSVTYEKARTLMEAVLYCLSEYHLAIYRFLNYDFLNDHNSDTDSPARRDISVKEQYDAGVKLIFEKVEDIRRIFNELSPVFEDFGVKCLRDTVQKGIPQFLKWYDIKFCPQDTILALDYPVLADCISLKGADAVYRYIRAIQIEQLFLGAFDKNYVTMVLESYHFEYREMAENICSIVLVNTIGHMAVKKPLSDRGFSREEYLQLSEIFGGKSISDIENTARDFVEKMIIRFYENDREMAEYLCRDSNNMAVRIDTAVRHGRLERIFVV